MDTIYIDCDGVIMDTNRGAIEYYNYKTNSNIKVEDIDNFSFANLMVKWEKADIDNMFIQEEFFKFIKPVDGCIETLKKLHDEGYSLKIVTIHKSEGIIYKAKWIESYLKDIVDEVIYVTHNGKDIKMDKSFLHGSIFLDDNTDCLNSCTEITFPICFGDYKYNKNWNGRKANTWNEAYNIIKDIENELNSIGG